MAITNGHAPLPPPVEGACSSLGPEEHWITHNVRPVSADNTVRPPLPRCPPLALDPRGEPCGLLRGAPTLAASALPIRGAPKVEYDTAEADLS
ncbi:hypothetical protein SCP_0214630 [Sparassis crispa]|uniref:Uncharacterized protein n=1 Tax=Sparassis crispa TaxID=139825 RepID=A0A401GDK3_9APHY|nr:hypothetical protein SCP_0214630 [Sparassis crispa]GBE80252.1 hypothetical protein SCP_0214630 [Sparassis crispa]